VSYQKGDGKGPLFNGPLNRLEFQVMVCPVSRYGVSVSRYA
jgi:hypothetical protein